MQSKNVATDREMPPPYAGPSGSNSNRPAMVSQPYSSQAPQNPHYIYVQPSSGNCTRGGDHVFTTEFTLGGILCALFFFPFGILFCLCLTEKRCVKCGGRFD